jgi:hypothetical protein
MNKSRKQREGQAVGSPRVHAYTLEKKTNTEVSNGAGKEQKMNLHSLQGDKAIRCQWSPARNARNGLWKVVRLPITTRPDHSPSSHSPRYPWSLVFPSVRVHIITPQSLQLRMPSMTVACMSTATTADETLNLQALHVKIFALFSCDKSVMKLRTTATHTS